VLPHASPSRHILLGTMKRTYSAPPSREHRDLVLPDPLAPDYMGTYTPPPEYRVARQRKKPTKTTSKPSSPRHSRGS
jgi:hypothetical protein